MVAFDEEDDYEFEDDGDEEEQKAYQNGGNGYQSTLNNDGLYNL